VVTPVSQTVPDEHQPIETPHLGHLPAIFPVARQYQPFRLLDSS
jgi:hypothetical protein